MNEREMTRDAIAEVIGVSGPCITRWRDNEGLPFRRIGHRIVYDIAAVAEWYIHRVLNRRGIRVSIVPSRTGIQQYLDKAHPGDRLITSYQAELLQPLLDVDIPPFGEDYDPREILRQVVISVLPDLASHKGASE